MTCTPRKIYSKRVRGLDLNWQLRCLIQYGKGVNSFSFAPSDCFRLSSSHADALGLRKQSHDCVDGNGLGHGPALLAIPSNLPALIHDQRSRVCFVNTFPEAA